VTHWRRRVYPRHGRAPCSRRRGFLCRGCTDRPARPACERAGHRAWGAAARDRDERSAHGQL